MRIAELIIFVVSNSHNIIYIVQRPNAPLGLSIAGGVGSPLGDVPIFVALVHDSGPARGKIKVLVEFFIFCEINKLIFVDITSPNNSSLLLDLYVTIFCKKQNANFGVMLK